MSYDATILADSPFRYYKCNESGGTSIIDYGSQGQNGTISGSYTLNQAALAVGLGKCIQFSGGSISLPTTGLPVGSHVISMECWISCISIPGSFPTILALGSNAQDQQSEININGFGPNFYYSLNNDDLNGHATATATTYYLLTVWDGTKQQFYVGVGGTLTNYNRVPTGTPNLTYGSASIATSFSTGYVSSVAIYNTALSSTQGNNHYNAGLVAASTKMLVCDGYGGVFS